MTKAYKDNIKELKQKYNKYKKNYNKCKKELKADRKKEWMEEWGESIPYIILVSVIILGLVTYYVLVALYYSHII